MRRNNLNPTSVLASGMLAACLYVTPQAIASEDLVLMGATLITGDDTPAIHDSVVVISGGDIECAGAKGSCNIKPGVNEIDLSGQFISPGLVDAHIHFFQTGWLDGRPDGGIGQGSLYNFTGLQAELEANTNRWHNAWLCSGITSVYDVGGFETSVGYQTKGRQDIDTVQVRSAGPLISPISKDSRWYKALQTDSHSVFLTMTSDDEAVQSVHAIKAMGSDTVKVWYVLTDPSMRPDLDRRLMLIGEEVKSLGMDLIVHATELEGAKVALKAGARLLVHSVEDQPVDQEFLDLLVENEAFYNPTLMVGRNWTRAIASVALGVVTEPDDPNKCIDADTLSRLSDAPKLQSEMTGVWAKPDIHFKRLEDQGKALVLMQENLAAIYKAGGKIVVGTDSGNPLTMHGPAIYEEMELMQAAGMPPLAVIRSATSLGGNLLGDHYKTGVIKAGYDADLVIMPENPLQDVSAYRSITHVMRSGKLRPIKDFARGPAE